MGQFFFGMGNHGDFFLGVLRHKSVPAIDEEMDNCHDKKTQRTPK